MCPRQEGLCPYSVCGSRCFPYRQLAILYSRREVAFGDVGAAEDEGREADDAVILIPFSSGQGFLTIPDSRSPSAPQEVRPGATSLRPHVVVEIEVLVEGSERLLLPCVNLGEGTEGEMAPLDHRV